MSTTEPTLSADRPSSDPAQDLYGHAPFAKTLAKAISGYRDSEGIVLALYGPWGSGKSTVLAYVEHELGLLDKDVQPVVVTFNPWWFSGQEHLARAFLGQLQAVLPAKYAGFKELGNQLSQFSSAIGGAVDIAGAYFGIPLGGKAIEAGAKLLASKPKDVPALKKAISALLLKEKKRVLVIVDDIDRLSPEEVRQLFTVIKALADFPYVTYLLAFDREVASAAISQQTGLPGERYLEKIIQVPFELPRADRTTLHQALFNRLDKIVAATPAGLFQEGHWQNIFTSGLAPLFTVPRDVVRLTNAISATYPAVVGEVNPVDFIALECLRVFLPQVYDTIRTTAHQFTGHKGPDQHEKEMAVQFHQTWLGTVPVEFQPHIKDLMERLFPRLESVWGNMHYTGDSMLAWRRELRICAGEDIFQAYFRLSLPPGAVSRADVNALLSAATEPATFAAILRSAKVQKLPSGVSKARALLERIMDFVPGEMQSEHARPVITAMFEVGDELLLTTDEGGGFFGSGNETRMARIGYHLLKKVPADQRFELLRQATSQAQALRCSQRLIGTLSEEADKAAKGEGDALLTKDAAQALRTAWVQRAEQLAQSSDFIDRPSLGAVLSAWRNWGGEANAKAWAQQAASTDEGLLRLINAFSYEVRTQGMGDYAVHTYRKVKPATVENYFPAEAAAERVRGLLQASAVPEHHDATAKEFVRAWDAFKAGEPEED